MTPPIMQDLVKLLDAEGIIYKLIDRMAEMSQMPEPYNTYTFWQITINQKGDTLGQFPHIASIITGTFVNRAGILELLAPYTKKYHYPVCIYDAQEAVDIVKKLLKRRTT